jgi:hypothetical protein
MIGTDTYTPFNIPITAIKVEETNILELLGYNVAHVEPFIAETIRKRIEASGNLIAASGGYIIKRISSLMPKEGILTIDNQEFNVGKIIGSHLNKSEFVAFFIATVGKALETQSKELFIQNEMLDGYVVNLIASEAAESCAEYIHHHIKNLALTRNLQITNRYSPGYCNWNVAEQFKLFSFFPETFNDVTLTDSALMNPVKSVSGIIGIGEHSKFNHYKCSICNDQNCSYRNRKSRV